MVIENEYHQGESILGRITVNTINYADATAITITVTDSDGNSQTYTKAGGTVTQGASSNIYQFEITSAQSSAFSVGGLTVRGSVTYPNALYSGNSATDIFERKDRIYLKA